MNVAIEKFEERAVKRGGLFLFSGPDALLVIEEARRSQLPILGIDGIFFDEEKTRPSLDDSVDFTIGNDKPVDVYGASVDFVKRHSNLNLYFEIVFGAAD